MTDSTLRTMKNLRQSRQFDGESMNPADLQSILEIARWSGSSRNNQPWQLVVVDDREQLKRLAHVRELNAWLEHAAVALAIVLPGESNVSHSYDEGRLSERIMLAADVLGYGSGTAWYPVEEQSRAAKEILGVPESEILRSLVVIGHATPGQEGPVGGGRKELTEIVSYNRFNQRHR